MQPLFLPRWTLSWVLSLLLAFPPSTLIGIGQAHAIAKNKADPAQIARGIHQWTGYLAKQAGNAKQSDLSKNNKRAAPFWESVQRLSSATSRLERDLASKRSGYLKTLGDSRSAFTSTRVTYQQSGAKVAGIDKALANIERGISLLERNAGPAKAAKSSSKGLNPAQKRQLDAMKQKQKELQRKLKQVESKVGKNDAAIRAIRDIRSHSNRIYNSGSSAGDFFAALMAARIIDGMLWGWHWWWGPWGGWIGPWCGGFVDIYYESIEIVDIDIDIIDAEIAVEDELIATEFEQAELDAIDDELSRGDFDLSDADIDAIADVELDGTGDLDAETLPELPDEGASFPDSGEMPEAETLPEFEAEVLPEPKLLPEPEPIQEPEPMPEPEFMPEPDPMPIEDSGSFDMAPDNIGDFDGGGFDGGGFDAGGMDFDGGGMDFDGGGMDIDF